MKAEIAIGFPSADAEKFMLGWQAGSESRPGITEAGPVISVPVFEAQIQALRAQSRL
jgi:hypothetical protein